MIITINKFELSTRWHLLLLVLALNFGIVLLWMCIFLGNLGPYEFKPAEYVKISQPPVLLVQKNVGKHVELHCEAMGSPPPTIQWYKGHMRITEVSNVTEFVNIRNYLVISR